MKKAQWSRLLFVVLLLTPMVLLQGEPQLTPAWLHGAVSGVPILFWLVGIWFAVIVVAAWLPTPDEVRP